ncbi:MAG: glucose-1-phosphate thymidylyltransferase [Bacteroidetes bacterium]|nr:MAG: glucose-1-phosphate thymidylyltransferase [Bacteroidota bacterium]
MKIALSDSGFHQRFKPLTFAKPVGALRVGMFTNLERWKLLLPEAEIFFRTESYLEGKFPRCESPDYTIDASVIPDHQLAEALKILDKGQGLTLGGKVIVQCGNGSNSEIQYDGSPIKLEQLWDFFQQNDHILRQDFELATKNKKSQELPASNTLIGGKEQLFIEEGASIQAATINVASGPVYIGKDAEVMEGSLIRGPFYLGEHAAIKMGAKVYGATTIGPHCKVGGEISNVIFQGYSNKGHDGFLGNSLIGEWCNLGADTNSSNLKNNYSPIRVYSYEKGNFIQTELLFMGLVMGDHGRSGINTMFNTATVVGFSSNVYGSDFPKKFIPSFSWGGADGFVPFEKEKAIEAAKAMMQRRKIEFGSADQQIFDFLYSQTFLE